MAMPCLDRQPLLLSNERFDCWQGMRWVSICPGPFTGRTVAKTVIEDRDEIQQHVKVQPHEWL